MRLLFLILDLYLNKISPKRWIYKKLINLVRLELDISNNKKYKIKYIKNNIVYIRKT